MLWTSNGFGFAKHKEWLVHQCLSAKRCLHGVNGRIVRRPPSLKHKHNIITPSNPSGCWCAAGGPSCCPSVMRSLQTRLSAVIRGREEMSVVIREGRGQQRAKWSHGGPGGLRGLWGRVVNTWCPTCGFTDECRLVTPEGMKTEDSWWEL